MPEGPRRYYCWKCDPQRTFLTPEAKAKHMRTVHGDSQERTRDPDLDAYYDWDARMYRPGPPRKRRRFSRPLRRLFGLNDDE